MITANWNDVDGEIGAIMARFNSLPRFMAKKHLRAAVARTLRPGVSKLRAMTPPMNTRRGRRKKGEKPASTGELRRGVKVKTRYKGTNRSGYVYGVIGYKAGLESKRALWLEYGTRYIEPRRFMQAFHHSFKSEAEAKLTEELRKAFEAATREVAANVGAVARATAGTYRRRSR